tara:strand:+ start:4570 stop:4869 length:300 start_codon:yes stop_codon:yes gene_type:complete
MINLELKYYDISPFNDDVNVVYQRIFNIDYLSITKEIQITEFEFQTITNLNHIKLCDNTYEIISKEFQIEIDSNCWILHVQSVQEIQERRDSDYEDLPF